MTKIYLKDWSAWTPNIKHKENWRVWAQNQPIATFDDQLNISDVPAMLRRRLSSVGKMAIACANDTEQTAELRPSLFCSRHGELARSIELLTSLAMANYYPLPISAYRYIMLSAVCYRLIKKILAMLPP
jgi:hypothetical protein